MLGVTAAAGTGKIIEEVVSNKKPTIELEAFDPARFS
jgi:glycine/D-amino acid oxidase-like deaminating enzyme